MSLCRNGNVSECIPQQPRIGRQTVDEFYDQIKGLSTKRLIRLRDMMRKTESPTEGELSKLKAINKELRLRTKRRYGKAL